MKQKNQKTYDRLFEELRILSSNSARNIPQSSARVRSDVQLCLDLFKVFDSVEINSIR